MQVAHRRAVEHEAGAQFLGVHAAVQQRAGRAGASGDAPVVAQQVQVARERGHVQALARAGRKGIW